MNANEQRMAQIRTKLEQGLQPSALDIVDESHLHAGHPGAATGKGHFNVRITAEAFAGRPPLERHRMVYEALGEMMQNDIHALRIRATAPGEP